MKPGLEATRTALLRQLGQVFLETPAVAGASGLGQAVALQVADLGFVLSTRLEQALDAWPAKELQPMQEWLWRSLAATVGAGQQHQPLFRKFPRGIPTDTQGLWVQKVLSHYLQAPEQPCLFCQQLGTTHQLSPCRHVVCDRCFDGANYSACPVCEHAVDMASPFFRPSAAEERRLPQEAVTFRLIDLGADLDASARDLLVRFCARTQAMSPADRQDLIALLEELGERCLDWLPATIPLKETVATVFGTLFRLCPPDVVLASARRHLRTATDVLRFLVAYSGADPALQGETVLKTVSTVVDASPPGLLAKFLGDQARDLRVTEVQCPVLMRRFKMARLSRPLRRVLLRLLEGFDRDLLLEDMLRHRSYWVWVGEFLHPHEHAKRFPNVARAFQVVRKKAPDGTPAPTFRGWNSRFEAAAAAGDPARAVSVLRERPGELARRLDHALRLAAADAQATEALLGAFESQVTAFSTPVLLTLRSVLPTRTQPAAVRIYWPKGTTAKGVSGPDWRPTLPPQVVERTVATVEAELLRRLANDSYDDVIIDRTLQDVIVPFNERTASPAAISLPRGSRIAVPAGKVTRMFLHWCEPKTAGQETDLDLSVGLYDADWQHIGVCSYYQLKCPERSADPIAISAGDRRDAPFPDGATEFVDLHHDAARKRGVRYAVMVVNAYAGLPFSQLDRAFAGVMFRDDVGGKHFDPRTVKFKFALQGENGVYLPLVLDIEAGTLHWLDTHAKGQFQFNNVETSNSDIRKICPEMITYFASGVRMSMYDLCLLHAAARGHTVWLRDHDSCTVFRRHPEEPPAAFLHRLTTAEGGEPVAAPVPAADGAVFAALLEGDLDLHDDARRYVLFPARLHGNLTASDLITW